MKEEVKNRFKRILEEILYESSEDLKELKSKLETIIHCRHMSEKEKDVEDVIKKFSAEDLEICLNVIEEMEKLSKEKIIIDMSHVAIFRIRYGIEFNIDYTIDNNYDYGIINQKKKELANYYKGYNDKLLKICKKYETVYIDTDVLIFYLQQWRKLAEECVKSIIE